MPGFVVRAGLADAVVPLEEVVPELLREFQPGTRRLATERSAK
jgi:chemotaxis response regulator CheB